MEIRKEKAFPRGGKKPALFKSKKNSNFSLFRKPKIKAKKKTKKNVIDKEITATKPKNLKPRDPLEVRFVEDLKASVVQEGMLVLGIVSQITEKIVNISLPGRLRGVITLANVSEFYRQMIESENVEVPGLKDMFQVGDVLPVQVLTVSENHSSLMLTCDPKCVNHKLSYNLVEDGLILVGNLKSQEDHGFIIDFGIDNLSGFLNHKKVEPDRSLVVGQVVRCGVIKCNQAPGSCNVEVSMLKKDLESAVIKKNSSLPIYCFVPGFQFEITYQKKLRDGLEVSYGKGNSTKGYIYEEHLLKKFPSIADIELGSQSIGTLLYVKPLVNFLYFKIMPKKQETWPFEYGKIVSGKVVKVTKSGIFFKVSEGSKKAKCFVPFLKLRNAEKLLESKSDLENLYPVGKKVSKIRLAYNNFMGRFYFGATDRASLTEKYYSVSDVKCGEVVSCKIVSFGKSSAHLQIGKTVTGIVAFGDMTDIPLKNPTIKFKVGQVVKARVLEVDSETKFVRLTMKPTLVKQKKILCSWEDCKKGKSYTGTIMKVTRNNLQVFFFNRIMGIVPKHLTPFPDNSLLNNFSKRQLVKCSIVSFENNQLCLSLLTNDSGAEVAVGKKYKVVVVSSTQSGLMVEVEAEENKKCQGFLPAVLLTAHYSLSKAFHSTYTKGETLMAYCVSNKDSLELPVFGSAEVFEQFYEGKSDEELSKSMTENSIIPFLFLSENKKTGSLVLRNLVPGKSNWRVFSTSHDFSNACFLSKYQLVYGKIVKIFKDKDKLHVSIQLNDVWDRDYHSSLNFFDSYLKSLNILMARQKEKLNAYSEHFYFGCPVKGTIEEVRSNSAVLRTNAGDLGVIEGKFSEGQEASGKIIWIDAPGQMIYIREKIGVEGAEKCRSITPENDYLRAKVLFIYEEATVVELRGRGNGYLAFIPRRRHLNDFHNSENVFAVGEEIRVWITKKESNYLLAMDRRVVALQEKAIWKKYDKKLKDSVQSLKRKLEEEKRNNKKRKTETESEIEVVDVKLAEKKTSENELPEVKEEIEDDEDLFNSTSNSLPRLEYDDIEIKSENESEEKEKADLTHRITNEERILLSSSSESEEETDKDKKTQNSSAFKIGFNWDVLNNQSLLSNVAVNKEESSDEEDDESKLEKKKRKHLTAYEKREKAKNEEERLRLIEERLMDTDREPECADDFDRAVLANPDSSALWLKYMAFHIQGTEIEKARAVAGRALKAISFREEQEKLNVWVALLNLENMYGNEDSLNKTLSEALQSNDPYKIHLHMLNIHGQSNRLQEMEKLGNLILKKYKDVGSMWHDVASAYFSVGKVESARNVLQKALSIVDKSSHVPLISKFAQLENKYGSPERAQTLYESILSSFPKRIDIWCCYVDMLVKSNLIDLARQVLERAISQTLRPRKMKTLFKKFISFEEAHGTPETVEKVREAAVEYVQTVGSLDA